MQPTRVVVAGSTGRMGARIVVLAETISEIEVVATPGRGGAINVEADVLIDFTLPDGFRHWLTACRDRGLAIMSGTTGLTADDERAIDAAAHDIAVLHATNTSLGIAVLNRLAADAARLLGDDYDLAILETHHRHKRDAPSGTAKTLAASIETAVGREVATESLRIGDVVGTHTVHLATDGERLELTHAATSRDTFARARVALRQVVGGQAGRAVHGGRRAVRRVIG